MPNDGTDSGNYMAEIKAIIDGTPGTNDTPGELVFSTAPDGSNGVTDRMKIRASGDVEVSTGDIVFSTAGKGICLGVTSNTDSNTLDDYEEGTFTPTLLFGGNQASMTFDSTPAGVYVKVGTMCYMSMRLTLSAKGSSTGAASVTGLPFTAANINGNFSGALTAFANNWYGSNPGLHNHIHTVDGNTSIISLRRLDDGGNFATFTNAHFDDEGDMILTLTMRTA